MMPLGAVSSEVS